MKRVLFLLSVSCALASAADLASVHRVYLLTMPHGLDQYMANHLAKDHVFEVVTDPKLADAIFTDHLGEGFQARLEEFSPTPETPKPEKAKAEAPKPENAKAGKPDKPDRPAKPGKPEAGDPEPRAKAGEESDALAGLLAPTENKLSNPAVNSSFGRAKGTVFLVEAKSREVVWSTFQPYNGFSSKIMNRTASDIVSRLKNDLKPKK